MKITFFLINYFSFSLFSFFLYFFILTGYCIQQGLPSSSVIKNLSAVKYLPAMQEMWVRAVAGEDPLEEGIATHFSVLAWEMVWTEEPSGVQSMGSQKSQT